MEPTNTRRAEFNFVKPENWDEAKLGACSGLEVRAQLAGGEFRSVVSTWKPSALDLDMLNAGGVIEVTLLRTQQCPMRLDVVAPILIEECEGGRLEITPDNWPNPPTIRKPAITINEEAFGHDEHGPSTP